MKFLIGGRITGKTTRLVNFVREQPNRILLVESLRVAMMIKSRHPDLRMRVYTHDEWLRDDGAWYHGFDIVIDDVEYFIGKALRKRGNPVLVAGTGQVVPDNCVARKYVGSGGSDALRRLAANSAKEEQGRYGVHSDDREVA